MVKSIYLKSVLGVYMLGACALASTVCQKYPGKMVCLKGDIDVVNASGIFRAEGTNIKKKVTIKGQAVIKSAEIHDMKIMGGLTIEGSSIMGKANIYGFLSARGSKFSQAVTVIGNYLYSEATKFEDIIVDGGEESANVSLLGGTVVNGSIIFKGKEGIVKLGPQAKVLGKVINGKQI